MVCHGTDGSSGQILESRMSVESLETININAMQQCCCAECWVLSANQTCMFRHDQSNPRAVQHEYWSVLIVDWYWFIYTCRHPWNHTVILDYRRLLLSNYSDSAGAQSLINIELLPGSDRSVWFRETQNCRTKRANDQNITQISYNAQVRTIDITRPNVNN